MPRGVSQERIQRIWDAAFALTFAAERDGQGGRWSELTSDRQQATIELAVNRASEAVTALRERERRNRSKR